MNGKEKTVEKDFLLYWKEKSRFLFELMEFRIRFHRFMSSFLAALIQPEISAGGDFHNSQKVSSKCRNFSDVKKKKIDKVIKSS